MHGENQSFGIGGFDRMNRIDRMRSTTFFMSQHPVNPVNPVSNLLVILGSDGTRKWSCSVPPCFHSESLPTSEMHTHVAWSRLIPIDPHRRPPYTELAVIFHHVMCLPRLFERELRWFDSYDRLFFWGLSSAGVYSLCHSWLSLNSKQKPPRPQTHSPSASRIIRPSLRRTRMGWRMPVW